MVKRIRIELPGEEPVCSFVDNDGNECGQEAELMLEDLKTGKRTWRCQRPGHAE